MNAFAHIFSSAHAKSAAPNSAAPNFAYPSGNPQTHASGPQSMKQSAAQIATNLRASYPTFASVYDTAATIGKLSLELLARILAAILAAIMSIFGRRKAEKEEEKQESKMRFAQQPSSDAQQQHSGPVNAQAVHPASGNPDLNASVIFADTTASTIPPQASPHAATNSEPSAPTNPHNMDIEDIAFRELSTHLGALSAPDRKAAHAMLDKIIPAVTNEKFIAKLSASPSHTSEVQDNHVLSDATTTNTVALGHNPDLDSNDAASLAKVAYEVSKQAKSALHHSYEDKFKSLQNGVYEILVSKLGEPTAAATAKLCVSSLPNIDDHGILNRETVALLQTYLSDNQGVVEELLSLKDALQLSISADSHPGVTDHQLKSGTSQQSEVIENETEMARPKIIG